MVTITTTPCASTFQLLGKTLHAWNCIDCGGSGVVATRSESRSVVIGPGWYDSMGHEMTREMRHDVAMLAACLGSKTWPPEA